jgi:hypothetical protein
VSMQLREHMLAVQTGRVPDTHKWMRRLV